MAEPDKRPVTMEELLVSSLAQTDALAKLLIEKGLITREEFMQKISEERATYWKLLQVKFSRYPHCIEHLIFRQQTSPIRCLSLESGPHAIESFPDCVPSARLANRNPGIKANEFVQPRFRREIKMVRMFIRHVVRDYRVWRRAYNAFDKERKGMGVVGHAVYRAVAKPNEVTVSHDFASISKAKAFEGSRRLREVMKGASVQGTPTIWFVKPA